MPTAKIVQSERPKRQRIAKTCSFSLSAQLYDALDAAAMDAGMYRSEFLQELIKKELVEKKLLKNC